jgi:hypothetical protein
MFDVFAEGRGIARGATPEQCWEVVRDHANWKNWMSVFSDSKVVSEGEGDPGGIGARRMVTDTQGNAFGEVINIWSPPRLFGYHIDENAPLKDHQGVISFTPVNGGTEIIWFMSGNNNGYIDSAEQRAGMRAVMQSVMDTAAADLVRACEACGKK